MVPKIDHNKSGSIFKRRKKIKNFQKSYVLKKKHNITPQQQRPQQQ
jgi:hypothetical protein